MANKSNCEVHGKPRYRIQYRTGRKRLNSNGLLVDEIRNFYGSSKTDAQRKLDEWLQRHEDVQTSTFWEEMEIFISDVLPADNSLKESSRNLYVRSWRSNFASQPFLFKKVGEVTGKDLQREIVNLTCSTATKKQIVKLLKKFYRWQAIENGVANVAEFVNVPSAEIKPKEERIVVWGDLELQKIFSAMENHRLRFLVWLAVFTGCRISELLAIEYNDFKDGTLSIDKQIVHSEKVDENGNRAVVLSIGNPKSVDSKRTIPLPAAFEEELELHRLWHEREMAERGYETVFVFTTSGGKFYERRNIYHALERVYKSAGVPVRKFHTYRSTFASRLASAGTPPLTLASLLGHGSSIVAQKYYVQTPSDEKRRAIERLHSDIIAT